MGQESEAKRPQGLLWKKLLQRQKAEADPAAETVPDQGQPEAQQEPLPVAPVCSVRPEQAESLWRVWDLWRQGSAWAPQPLVVLSEQESMEVPLTLQELEREALSLANALELWAKTRLKGLEHAEEAPPPDRDCGYFVHVSANKLCAWALVAPPSGDGEGPVLNKLAEALTKAGIKTGLDQAQVGWLAADGHYLELRVVARGTLPTVGRDGYVVDKFLRQQKREIQMDEKGNVDYRAQTYFQGVVKGDVICDIIPPEPGQPGVRVSFEKIEPAPVKTAAAPKGSNTDLSPDGAHLVAAMDGHLEFQGGVFQVRPILDIKGDVDYSTGNLSFRGDVHIYGDVRENFVVKATGKVTIDGLVEGATVEADGDVVISKGVLGNNKAVIKSKKLVRAKYLENCVVYSGDGTYADCIISSQIFSDSKISVTTGRGTIIGGCLTAAERVECTVLGSQSDRLTEIVLGELPYVQKEQHEIVTALAEVRKELTVLDQKLGVKDKSEETGDADTPEDELTPAQKRKQALARREKENLRMRESMHEKPEAVVTDQKELAKLRLRKSVLALKQDKLVKRQEELGEQRPDLGRCRLVCGTVYPTTKLTIGSDVRILDSVWKKCTAYYDQVMCEIHIS